MSEDIYARTTRTVLEIGHYAIPAFWGGKGDQPRCPGVRYVQDGHVGRMYLTSFASWCGSEVEG